MEQSITYSGEIAQTTESIDSMDLLNEALGNNSKFLLVQGGPILERIDETSILHLKNSAQQTLLIVTLTPATVVRTRRHRHNNRNHDFNTENIIQVTNVSGQVLLTGRGHSTLNVWSGASLQFLGRLGGSVRVPGLSAVGANNEILFCSQSDAGYCCGPPATEYSVISNGVTIAQVHQSNDPSVGAELSVSNPQNLDLRTKAFIILAANFVFIEHWAETRIERSGRKGLSQGSGFRFLFVSLSVCAFIGYVVYLITK